MSKIAQKIQKSQRGREFVYYFVLLLSCESKLSLTLIAAQVYQFKHKIILEPNCKLLLVQFFRKKILIIFPKCSGGGKGNSVQEELDDDGVKQRRKHFAALTIVELYSSSPTATERTLLCSNLYVLYQGAIHIFSFILTEHLKSSDFSRYKMKHSLFSSGPLITYTNFWIDKSQKVFLYEMAFFLVLHHLKSVEMTCYSDPQTTFKSLNLQVCQSIQEFI